MSAQLLDGKVIKTYILKPIFLNYLRQSTIQHLLQLLNCHRLILIHYLATTKLLVAKNKNLKAIVCKCFQLYRMHNAVDNMNDRIREFLYRLDKFFVSVS